MSLATPSLLAAHLRRGVGTSILVAILIAATVFVVALAPRALAQLGTAELHHELTAQPPGDIDLTGEGLFGFQQASPDASLESLVGATDDVLTALPSTLPMPLGAAAGQTQWVARTNRVIASPPSNPALVLGISLAVDLKWDQRVTLVDGVAPTRWSPTESADGEPVPIEIALEATTAQSMDLAVGDVIEFTPAPLRVSEIYEALDDTDPYWRHARDLLGPAIIYEQGAPPTVQASAYLAPESLVALADDFGEGWLSAWIPISADAWNYSDAEAVGVQVRNATASRLELPNFGEIAFRSTLSEVVEAVQAKVAASTALIALSSSGFLGVLLATYTLSIQALIRRRSAALALADARGATRSQLVRLMVIETAVLSLPGTILAIVLAAVLIPVSVGIDAWIVPIVVGMVPVVLSALLLPRGSLREQRRDLSSAASGPVRWIAEVIVVALALIALLLLQRRGLAESSATVGVDPLLAATPVLLAAAVGLAILRFYPVPLRLIQAAVRRRTMPAASLGAARATREPAVGVMATLALVVGMSMVVFTVVMVSTVGASLRQSALEQVGAHVQVVAHDLPDSLVSDIRDLDGVSSAVSLVNRSGVQFTDESGLVDTSVLLADTAQLHDVRPDIPVLGAKVNGAIPVLISADWSSQVDGTELSLVNSRVTSAGTIPSTALPGMTRRWILVDSAYASELGLDGQVPFTILAGLPTLDDGRGDLVDEITALASEAQPDQFADSVRVTTAAQVLDGLVAAPVVGALQAALIGTGIGTLLLTAIVVALATAAAAGARATVVGVARVLGMSRRQVALLTLWELTPVAIVALLVAAVLGLALPYVVLAALDLRKFFGATAAAAPTVDALWIAITMGVFVVAVVLASAVATLIGRRLAPAQSIRMGER